MIITILVYLIDAVLVTILLTARFVAWFTRSAVRAGRWVLAWRARRRLRRLPPPAPWVSGTLQWWHATGALAWVLHRHVPADITAAELRQVPGPITEAVNAIAQLTSTATDTDLALWALTVTEHLRALGADHA